MELELGNGCTVLVRAAKKTNEDLQVHLDATALGNLCSFLHKTNLQAASSSRTYRKTGQFQDVSKERKRKMHAAEAEESGDENLQG